MNVQANHIHDDGNATKAFLNEQLDGIGWAALLIASGTIWLLPEPKLPHGSWLIAVGTILLGLNAVRVAYGIRLNGFSLAVGILALLAGLSDFYEFKLPLFPIVLILIGALLLVNTLRKRSSTSTTSRGWCGDWRSEQGSNRASGPNARQ